jgi:sigma-B regulation protein RsbU (phosphoserine phosphatase)
VIAVGDVSGKGVPAALYGAFAGEIVRSRTFRRRFTTIRSSPGGVLASMNAILHERNLEEYFCTLCYAAFDFKKRQLVVANSGLPYPIRHTAGKSAPIELPGVPLGSFPGTEYEELTFDLKAGDIYVFCTDGIFETEDAQGREFGAGASSRSSTNWQISPRKSWSMEFSSRSRSSDSMDQAADDMTAVAVKITA